MAILKIKDNEGKITEIPSLLLSEKRNPNYHAEYFDITDDGEISVKPKYVESFPVDLIIPEVVNEITVNKLSIGMFKNNNRIVGVSFPDTIDEIPDECFNEAVNLKYLHNTERIKKIGAEAFRFTRIEKAVFPNLEEITGIKTFCNVPYLAYADVGKVTTIPEKTFKYCYYLSKIVGTNVTTVGEEAFMGTTRLINVDFVGNLTSVDDYAFWQTKFDYDWSAVSGLSQKATYAQINPDDFWSALTPTACENPTPTEFCQYDPRWVDVEYGAINPETGNPRIYENGCMQFCALHIYSGLKDQKFDTVFDFENIIKTYETPENPLLSIQDGTFSNVITLLNGIGLYTRFHSSWDVHELATLYNTLKNGGYAIVTIGAPHEHVVVVYGISDKGELLVLDSEQRYPYDKTKPACYKLPFNKLIAHTESFVTVPSNSVYVSLDFADTTTKDQIKFWYSWYCPEEYEFVKVGTLVVSKDNYNPETFYAGTTDTNVYDRNPTDATLGNDNTWSWFKSEVTSGQTWVAKAYVQYKDDNGEIQTVYSDIVEATKE